MKAITVRGIPEDIEKMVRKEAEKKRVSKSKALISILERGAGIRSERRKKTLYHDLDHLSGVWTKEEARAFEKNLALQRNIDEELWKKEEF